MTPISEHMLCLAQEMIALASDEWSDDEAVEFLDALNPEIRKQLLIAYLKGDRSRQVTVDRTISNKAKINAIKAWRSITGDGLREAKEAIEEAEFKPVNIPSSVTFTLRKRLAEELKGTGWKVV